MSSREYATLSRISHRFGQLLHLLALLACLLLFLMMTVICLDVFLRNVPLIPSLRGFPATNDLSEAALYLVTLLPAPWLLRQGKHIRIDIVLQALPARWTWYVEWVVDLLGLACSLVFVWYGVSATHESFSSGEMLIKAMATPMWWWLSVLPLTFSLLAVEFMFRMRRLLYGDVGLRSELEVIAYE